MRFSNDNSKEFDYQNLWEDGIDELMEEDIVYEEADTEWDHSYNNIKQEIVDD